MKRLEEDINKFKMNIEEIINKYKNIMENLDIYYNINNDIIKEYEQNRNRNYILLNNIKNINEAIEIEIRNIREKYDYGYNTNSLLYLYSEMNDKNMEIVIKYKPKEDNKQKVRIFGENFVNNNIQKCKIIYKEEEYELKEYLEDIDEKYDNKTEFEIKLKGINNITDMSSMFDGCEALSSLPDISKWTTNNVRYMD